MRIFWKELRKIWRPAPLLAALAILLLFGRTAIDYYLRTLPKQSEHSTALETYGALRERFGGTLDPEELPAAEKLYEQELAGIDRMIREWEQTRHPSWASFSAAGVTDYKSYCALLEKTDRTPEEEEAAALLLDSRSSYAHYRVQLIRGILERYEFETAALEDDIGAATQKALARCAEIAEDPQIIHSILHGYSIQAANRFAVQLALTIQLAVMLLLSPFPVRERLARIAQEQWPTHTGRRVLQYQFAAALATAALISVTVTAVLGWRFCAAWDAGLYWDHIAYSVAGGPIPWFTMTYGQYLLLLGGTVVCLGLATGALAFFLSRFSANYIAMLLKALPLYLVMTFTAEKLLTDMLYFGNALSDRTGILGIEPAAAAALLAVSLALNAAAARRELHREQR